MPFEYDWKLKAHCHTPYQVLGYLDGQKGKLVVNNQLETCTLCVPNVDRHKMRYTIYKCNSRECKKVLLSDGHDHCPWHTRVRACQEGFTSLIDQHDDHRTLAASPTKGKLNLQMKFHIRKWTDEKYKPSQSLNKLIDEFKLTSAHGLLPKVQSFAASHRRTRLRDTDFLDDMVETAAAYRYREGLTVEAAFVIGVEWDASDKAMLGGGSREDPLVIGCTSETLLRNLAMASDYPLHIDGTFKLSSFGYPVIVIGVSDAARQFHPVSFFLVSDLTQKQYQRALQATADMYRSMTGCDLHVHYVMADADDAERNACEAIDFSGEPPVFLMCWFHVMQNVRKLCRPLTTSAKRLVYRHMYRMHYARDERDFYERQLAAQEAWGSVTECVAVAAHIQKQWLTGRFAAWQCFRSPPGLAKTNNPLETFNADIKREYTEHELLSLNCLFKQLLAMAKHRAVRSPL